MVNKAFYANVIYCFGYLLFIWHNYNSGDSSQMIYFTILEIMSVVGVFIYIYSVRKTSGVITKNSADNQRTLDKIDGNTYTAVHFAAGTYLIDNSIDRK